MRVPGSGRKKQVEDLIQVSARGFVAAVTDAQLPRLKGRNTQLGVISD